jgi:acyl-ACP thioesterase
MYNSDLLSKKALPRNAAKLKYTTANERYAPQFSVRISDLDLNLHTNNSRYLKWVTDTYDLDFIMNNVPISAEINYLAESRFNDSIAILTSEEKENSSELNHSIMRTSDNTELCRLRINWKNNHS